MQVSKIPFNMKFSENTDLLDIPDDMEDMKKGVNFLLDNLDRDISSLEEAGIQSLLGVFNMMIGSIDEALFCLEESEKIYLEENKLALAQVSKIRKASVFMIMGKFGESSETLNSCLREVKQSKIKNIRSLKDRIFINFGKLKFIQKEYEASLRYFVSAMDERVAVGDIEKIEHIKHLLEIVGKKIENKVKS